MEMLGNIWNALSTENIQLTIDMGYPLIVLEIYFILLLFVNLLNIKCTVKQKLLYVIVTSIARNYK